MAHSQAVTARIQSGDLVILQNQLEAYKWLFQQDRKVCKKSGGKKQSKARRENIGEMSIL